MERAIESAFEATLNAASDEFVIAVHDLTHAILADRGSGGVKPPLRRMREAVALVRAEMERKGWQTEWNKIRDHFLAGGEPRPPIFPAEWL